MRQKCIFNKFNGIRLRELPELINHYMQAKKLDELYLRFNTAALSETDVEYFAEGGRANGNGRFFIGDQEVSKEVYEEYLRRDCRLLIMEFGEEEQQ